MRRALVPAAVALATAACGTQSGLHVEDGGTTVRPASLPSTSTQHPPTKAARTASLVLGAPAAIAYADGTLWCAVRPGGRLIGSLVRVDTVTGRVTGRPTPLPVSADPYLLAVTGEDVWLGGGDRLWRIDPTDGSIAATVSVDGRLTALTAPPGELWATVAGPRGGRLLHLDATSGRPLASAPIGPAPSALTVVPGAAWVTDAERQDVTRLTLRGQRIGGATSVSLPLSSHRRPTQVTVYAGSVWVYERGRVVRIDPATATVVGTTIVAPAAGGTIAAGSGGIWVITSTLRSHRGAVRLLDPKTGAGAGRRTVVGGAPTALATDGRGVWVVDSSRGRLVRVVAAPHSPA